MSSIAKRSDGSWRARYRDTDGKEHARHFSRRVDAQCWIDSVTVSVVRGDYVDPGAGKVTLRHYAQGWQASHVGRAATASLLDNALRVHILPTLGDRPMSNLQRCDVQALVKALSTHVSPGTVRNVYEFLNRIMQAAVDDRVIAHSPCQRIVLPARSEAEVTSPTAEQVRALADAVPARFRAVVVLLGGSGLRIGEALGPEVGDVDFPSQDSSRGTAAATERRHRADKDTKEHSDGTARPDRDRRTCRALGRSRRDELFVYLGGRPSIDVQPVEEGLACSPARDRTRPGHPQFAAFHRIRTHRGWSVGEAGADGCSDILQRRSR